MNGTQGSNDGLSQDKGPLEDLKTPSEQLYTKNEKTGYFRLRAVKYSIMHWPKFMPQLLGFQFHEVSVRFYKRKLRDAAE